MKIRHGFVSNSSSSSFIIKEKYLTDFQKFMIKNHIEFSKLFSKLDSSYKNHDGCHDAWSITEKDEVIHGWTPMNNFNMSQFFEYIGIPIGYFSEDN